MENLSKLIDNFKYYSKLIFEYLEELKEREYDIEINAKYLDEDENFKTNIRIMEVDRNYFDIEVYSDYYDERYLLDLSKLLEALEDN